MAECFVTSGPLKCPLIAQFTSFNACRDPTLWPRNMLLPLHEITGNILLPLHHRPLLHTPKGDEQLRQTKPRAISRAPRRFNGPAAVV